MLELYQTQAPITVANFLRYVDENRFADACFYRVVPMDNQPNNEIKIEVIQGGLKMEDHPQTLPAIIHETTQKLEYSTMMAQFQWHEMSLGRRPLNSSFASTINRS